MPDVVGRQVKDLPPSAVLLVEYETQAANVIATDPNEVVDRGGNGYARVSTLDGGIDLRLPLAEVRARIGSSLAR